MEAVDIVALLTLLTASVARSRIGSSLSTRVGMSTRRMKTASLGLLEVMVVRVNAGGDAPPDPPLLVTSWAIPPFFVFLQKGFWRISGKIYLAG